MYPLHTSHALRRLNISVKAYDENRYSREKPPLNSSIYPKPHKVFALGSQVTHSKVKKHCICITYYNIGPAHICMCRSCARSRQRQHFTLYFAFAAKTLKYAGHINVLACNAMTLGMLRANGLLMRNDYESRHIVDGMRCCETPCSPANDRAKGQRIT